MGDDPRVVDERGDHALVRHVDASDLVARPETVEEVEERHARLERCRVRDEREVGGLLGRRRASIAQPVGRAAITSLWSPKIDRAWVATARAAT